VSRSSMWPTPPVWRCAPTLHRSVSTRRTRRLLATGSRELATLVERMVRAQEGGSSALDQLGLGQLGASDLGLGDDLAGGAGLQDLLGRFAATMGPVLLGLQFGSAAGHLAQRALGQYALPIPWAKTDGLLFVPENVKAFADDWSLSLEETELWVCVHELTVHAVLRQPHVATRLDELLEASTAEAVALQQGLSERLGATSPIPRRSTLSCRTPSRSWPTSSRPASRRARDS